MGHLVFGGMQRLNIEAARRQAGQDLLQTPNPILPTTTSSGTPISLSTPDILNSLINITNPFFESNLTDDTDTLLSQQDYEEPEKKVFANLETPAVTTNSSSCAISGSQSQSQTLITSCTSYPGGVCSPLSVTSTSTSSLSDTGVNSPPPQQSSLQHQQHQPSTSVESMRSKLIKDSLKLTIQTKRKNSGKEELDVKSDLVAKRPKREELTAEDEERRKRRRERNKVAATKCRNKKKEKTVLLVQEAEVLDSDNITLKSEIAQMEEEFKRLTDLLTSHTPTCMLNAHNHEQKPSTSSTQPQLHNNQDLDHGHQSQNQNLMSTMNSPYHASVGSVHHDYNQDLNPHLAINTTHHNHNHNHFMGSNSMNNMNYFGPMHHQTIQLS